MPPELASGAAGLEQAASTGASGRLAPLSGDAGESSAAATAPSASKTLDVSSGVDLVFSHYLVTFFLPAIGALPALAGAGVRVGALASHREPATVPDPLVRADVDFALDVLLHLAPQVTFDLVRILNGPSDPGHLVVGEVSEYVSSVRSWLPGRSMTQEVRCRYPIYVGERNQDLLITRKVDARDTSHLALPLLVSRIANKSPRRDHAAE